MLQSWNMDKKLFDLYVSLLEKMKIEIESFCHGDISLRDVDAEHVTIR